MISIKRYGGLDLNSLQLLGSGTQGKVYKIDATHCIKVFRKERYCEEEVYSLKIAQTDSHFPTLFEYGEDYLIRELIHGVELDAYLTTTKLTSDISEKIIVLYEAMQKVGYERLDCAVFHIFLTPYGNLKLIDTAKAMRKKATYPRILIDGLDQLGHKDIFLTHVSNIRPDLYHEWFQ